MKKRGDKEGSIFEERPGRWVALLTLGWSVGSDGMRRRNRKKFTAATRRAVQRKLTEALREQQTGGIIPIQRDSLGAFLERFPAQLAAAGRAASTVSSYKWLIETYIAPALGTIPLTKLTQVHVNEFMQQRLEAGLSARTVAYCHAVIRSALSRALKDGLVSRNVAKLATPPAQRRGSTIEPLTPDDARRFLAAVRGHRTEALYSVALALGLRQGEALGLEWDAIDLVNGTLMVTQTVQRIRHVGLLVERVAKTQKSLRALPMPPFAIQALIAHKARQDKERATEGWREHGLVFPSSAGTPMEPRNVLRHFHRVLKKLGIDRRRFHDLRHTAASLLLAQGASLHDVQLILGHATIRMTADLYGHAYMAVQRELVGKLEAVFSPVAPSVAPSEASKHVM